VGDCALGSIIYPTRSDVNGVLSLGRMSIVLAYTLNNNILYVRDYNGWVCCKSVIYILILKTFYVFYFFSFYIFQFMLINDNILKLK